MTHQEEHEQNILMIKVLIIWNLSLTASVFIIILKSL